MNHSQSRRAALPCGRPPVAPQADALQAAGHRQQSGEKAEPALIGQAGVLAGIRGTPIGRPGIFPQLGLLSEAPPALGAATT
jgi:hypothetical protein